MILITENLYKLLSGQNITAYIDTSVIYPEVQKNPYTIYSLLLDKFMLESISSFDTANERFYHGMMLGLCAVLSNRYQVRSNRKSGIGRFDIMLIPRMKNIPGFIYEFKYTKDEKADLNELADEALKQIEEKKYETEHIDAGISDIVKIGIAFRGKNAVVKK